LVCADLVSELRATPGHDRADERRRLAARVVNAAAAYGGASKSAD
jgi:hypothetical protein